MMRGKFIQFRIKHIVKNFHLLDGKFIVTIKIFMVESIILRESCKYKTIKNNIYIVGKLKNVDYVYTG